MGGLVIGADGFTLPVDVLGEAVGIVATRGAGKTYASVTLIEEANAIGVPVVVIDPTGVYHGLRSSASGKGDGLPFYVFGGPHGDLPLEKEAGRLIADAAVDTRHSFVLDVSDFSKGAARRFVADFLERLYERQARGRTSMLVVIDEADEFAPQTIRGARDDTPRCLGAVESLVKRGRSRGIGVVLISQRTQAINKDVLDLVDTMFAMRLGAPRSRKTVQEWLEVKEAEDDLGVIGSLSSLPTGTAWVWSPVRGILEKVKVRRIRTFDSYSTPKPGAVKAEPARRAALDLDELGEQMQAVVERKKMNDPVELHRRIGALEGELMKLRARPAQKEVVTVQADPVVHEVPVFSPPERELLERLEARLADVQSNAESVMLEASGVGNGLREFLADVEKAAKPPKVARPRVEITGHAPLHIEGPELAPATPSVSVPPTSSNGLPDPEQRILDALAWLEALGIRPSDRVQVAFLAGYKSRGGRFQNLLGGLRSNGYVAYPGAGVLELTADGREHARHPDLPRTNEALHEAVLARLDAPQQRLLRPILAAYPHALSRRQVAEAAEYDAAGGRFQNLIGSLRTLGLVEYPASGMVVARDILFPVR